MLDSVRAAMVEQDGKQPGDPERGVRAVISAINRENPPRRLVLGGAGHAAVVEELHAALTEVQADEALAKSADFPVAQGIR